MSFIFLRVSLSKSCLCNTRGLIILYEAKAHKKSTIQTQHKIEFQYIDESKNLYIRMLYRSKCRISENKTRNSVQD